MPWASWGRPVALGLENKDTARKPRCGPVRVGSVPSPLRPGAPSVLRACPWGVFGAGPADSAHASGPCPNSESRALPTASLPAHLSEGLAPCPHPTWTTSPCPVFPDAPLGSVMGRCQVCRLCRPVRGVAAIPFLPGSGS